MKKILQLIAIFVGTFFLTTNASASEYSEIFKETVGDGNFYIPAIYKDDQSWKVNMEWLFLWPDFPSLASSVGWNYDYDTQKIQIVRHDIDGTIAEILESQKVNLNYHDVDKNVQHEIDIASRLLPEATNCNNCPIVIDDLSLINFLVYEQSNLDIAIATKYSEIVKYYLNLNSHFDVAFFIDSGEASSIFSAGYGDLYLLYDGIFYDSIEFGVGLKNVIYIPDTTPDTHEDYIEAVTNRLNSYMPDVDFEVSFGGELSKEDVGDDYQYYIGSTFYIIKINGKSYSFIVETKPIDELTSPVFTGKDTETGITIESSSSDIPLDTKVEVNEIEEETSEFTDIQ